MLFTLSLKKNRQFRYVYSRGRSAANRLLVIYKQPNGLAENRLGISVSRKVGQSVVRSRVKRLIRENYRLMEVHVARGYDIVIVARVAAGTLARSEQFRQIGLSLTSLLIKQELLHRDE